ncbi:MAG: hypothetical protein ABJD66_00680 [Cellulophaga sp.]|uniref:hypothetical protein n=1 Tax=unclassified Cellulophaga TaxID=2634405 RepID=UPI000C2C5718|nr:hypothetical protein [Cellulophaga sp. RHA19]PKB45098.1 hypothetical protein AX016_3336 [Cellulophaga sp. RHA19]
MTKKSIAFLILIFTILTSCKENKTSESYNDTQEIVDASAKENLNLDQSDLYCKVQIGSTEKEALSYDLKSSNTLKKGFITTTFSISLAEEMYNNTPLDIELMMHNKSNSPKLNTGTYPIKGLMAPDEGLVSYFDIIGNVVDMESYQNAIDANILDDLEDNFVILPEGANKLIIESSGNLTDEEDGEFYKMGKQLLKGNLEVLLLRVSTKEKVNLRVDFKIINECGISKKI